MRRYRITWRDAEGVELEGWYNGGEAGARRFAESQRIALGAVGVTVTER